ncbi:hypothetical protein BD293_1790 [Roseinatronobacter monicus]|uniref:Uncharacterized protein n=1 Tax=Roseinatronobacter monicus TaxID=393481 RepID=A0A543KDL0_9RHOB|nr:hypothetical protein BD293_1790 [Roseinatronobacter monicus]
MQHSVTVRRARNADMIGKLEPPLKGAVGDTTVQILARALLVCGTPRHDKRVLLHFDHKVISRETGHRDGNAIRILVGLLDVIPSLAKSDSSEGFGIPKSMKI